MSQSFEEIFSRQSILGRYFALATWQADLANKHALCVFRHQYDSYCLMFRAYGGDPDIMARVLVPVVPNAWAVRIASDGYPEVYETDRPLLSPAPELPKHKKYPDGHVIFGRDLAEDGYPGWYASSKIEPDGTVQSTTVAVGTISEGPDGEFYTLTAVGFAGLAKYWIRRG